MDKYEKEAEVGAGTFGVVYRAIEKASGRVVALKKLRAKGPHEGVEFTTLREIKLLQELRHPNIVRLLDVFTHRFNLYICFEFAQGDLETLIRDRRVTFKPADVKSWIQQLLRGLEFLHARWILHRDLKPSNLLLGADGMLKLADFGLARRWGTPSRMTPQVVTRWYRPPELLFGARLYSHAVDMWGAGCIFAELLLRAPLFPGENDIDQLGKIFAALGTPSEETWPGLSALPDYLAFHPAPGVPLQQIFAGTGAGPDALELLARLLALPPQRRPTARDALAHRYFSTPPEPTPPAQLPRPPSQPLPRAPAPAPARSPRPPQPGKRRAESPTAAAQPNPPVRRKLDWNLADPAASSGSRAL
jgi:cyclin-dependent kinase 7